MSLVQYVHKHIFPYFTKLYVHNISDIESVMVQKDIEAF